MTTPRETDKDEYMRADGQTVCVMCGKKYRDHIVSSFTDENGDALYVMCDGGTLVKL
jgi:hypothetical protein